MAQNEQKELLKAMGEIIDQKVMPELKEIKEKLTGHDEKFETIIEAVVDTKVDITEMQEDLSDMGYTTQRIETRLNSVVHDQDDLDIKTKQLNRRVLKLEAKKA